MDLYRRIFNMIYGFPLDELNKLKDKPIRDSIIRLRRSYQDSVPITDYMDDNIRKAYMLCYYVHYIYPAYKITKDHLLHHLSAQNKNKYRISYFGAGPAPEVYGSLKAFSEFGFNARIEINMLDLEVNWVKERKVTFSLISEFEHIRLSPVNSILGCDLRLDCRRSCLSFKECNEIVLNSDVLFMQNTINHLGNNKYFIKALKEKIRNLKSCSFFVIIDLDYSVVKDAIRQIIDYVEPFASSVVSNINEYPAVSLSEEPVPPELIQSVFTGESGLKPKKRTRYYYAVIQMGREVPI